MPLAQERRLSYLASRTTSSSGISSSASTPNPSSAAAPSTLPGAALPPPAISSSPTTLASPPSSSPLVKITAAANTTETSLFSTTRPPPTPSSNTSPSLMRATVAVVASCDGLLLLSYDTEGACFSICNPATRQCAPLPVLCDFMMPLGMYRHHPTGEYRILLYDKNEEEIEDENKEIYVRDGGCCIFELGSVQPSRNIGCLPEAEQVLSRCGHGAVILLHGNMHWYLEQRENGSDMVLVFDTTTESFQHMQAPVVQVAPGFPLYNDLFDMDGMLGMFSCNDDASIIDIWVLKDYENMVWTFKCKIELPVTEMKLLCGGHDDSLYPVVIHGDGE
ncbi:hypothetical protein VPH35_047419 [Triticum aestivum]